MYWALMFLRIAIAVALIVSIGGYLFQEKLIFYPTPLSSAYQFNFKNQFKEEILKLGDDDIHSLYFEKENAPGVIVYFHGNAGSMQGWGALADEFVDETGWNIWIVDYPGFGKSTGRIRSEKQLHDLANLVFAVAVKMNPDKKVVVYGRSLGSGLATALAAKNQIDGIILETPFYSLTEMAQHIFPWVPVFLLRYRMNSHYHLMDIHAPLLVIHGTDDRVVPYAQGKRLYDEFHGDKKMITVEGGDHNDLIDSGLVWPSIKDFLQKLAQD